MIVIPAHAGVILDPLTLTALQQRNSRTRGGDPRADAPFNLVRE